MSAVPFNTTHPVLPWHAPFITRTAGPRQGDAIILVLFLLITGTWMFSYCPQGLNEIQVGSFVMTLRLGAKACITIWHSTRSQNNLFFRRLSFTSLTHDPQVAFCPSVCLTSEIFLSNYNIWFKFYYHLIILMSADIHMV